MSIGLVGKKLGMTKLFKDSLAIAVTVIKVEDNQITQIKTEKNDGYNSIQVSIAKRVNKKGQPKTRGVSKGVLGHYKKAGVLVGTGLKEFRLSDVSDYKLSDSLNLSLFEDKKYVDVSAISKGKGFQGGVKRHNFRMQDATHGNSLSHRALGSTGQCQFPGRVFKGKKMAGQMGNDKVIQKNLEIIRVDKENQIILVKGSVSGRKDGTVIIMPSKKQK